MKSARFFSIVAFVLVSLLHSVALIAAASEWTRIDYVWKKGDSLSTALMTQGIGRSKKGPRLYGKNGWVNKNLNHAGRTSWENITVGERVQLLVPSLSQDPQPNAPVASPEQMIEETLIPEVLPQLESGKLLPEAQEGVKAKSPLKIRREKPRVTRPSRADYYPYLSGFMAVVCLGIGVIFSLQNKERTILAKRRIVAQSFLSWLTLEADLSADHIGLAESLFVGTPKVDAMLSYELMGFLQKDIALLKEFESKRKAEVTVSAKNFDEHSLQAEYLVRYGTESPEILGRILQEARSRFFIHKCQSLFLELRRTRKEFQPIAASSTPPSQLEHQLENVG